MKKQILIFIIASLTSYVYAQSSDTIPKKGSYLYYGQPKIEDNSMFIEEAFNQEAGVIQHISNFIYNGGNFFYGYTQEIPLADVKQQFSFGFSYASFKKPTDPTNSNVKTNGIGDILLNYRPLVWGKNDWALVIPRFTVIVPTGNAQYGFGQGGWGGQFNLAVTKRLNSKITTHYNAGYTVIAKADHHIYSADGTPTLAYEKNIGTSNVGASAIWLVKPKFNFMVEYVATFSKSIEDDGKLVGLNNSIINPGFRFAIDVGKIQIVPGLGLPFNFTSKHLDGTGVFFYLSIEPAY